MTPIPLFRVWDKINKVFLHGGYIYANGRHFMPNEFIDPSLLLHPPGTTVGLEFDWYTRKFAQSGKPVYEFDRVKYAIKNDFGSFSEGEGTIKYDPDLMCYFIEREVGEPKDSISDDELIIVDVVGHAHV